MLPDERTTRSETLALPGDVEALVAAADRDGARPLLSFARDEGINVRTAGDSDVAFEESLVHPPDVVLIDDRIPPAGGIELCQRLKGNIRTHFVPAIVCTATDLRPHRLRALEAGADAVFDPATDAQERRTRLWALLRTRALHRRAERKHHDQGMELLQRRRWLGSLLHDLQGAVTSLEADLQYFAAFQAIPGAPHRHAFVSRIDDARGALAQLSDSIRLVSDFDRYEAGRLTPVRGTLRLGDLAAEIDAELRRQSQALEKPLALSRPHDENDPVLPGDRELVKRVMTTLIANALRRGRPGSEIPVRVEVSARGARFSVSCRGESLSAPERAVLFDPDRQDATQPTRFVLGLALARAVVRLHGGEIWSEDVSQGGVAFAFELKRAPHLPSTRAIEDGA